MIEVRCAHGDQLSSRLTALEQDVRRLEAQLEAAEERTAIVTADMLTLHEAALVMKSLHADLLREYRGELYGHELWRLVARGADDALLEAEIERRVEQLRGLPEVRA